MSNLNINFELDGQPGGTPANLPELKLLAQWGTREGQDEQEISTSSIEFVLEDAKRINQIVEDGLNGGVGIFEGIPYKIGLDSQNVFDGMIDLTNDANFVECEKVIANIVKSDGSDWLNEVADGFSFGYLRQKGFIQSSDYVNVPYVLNFRPEAFIVGQLTIAIYLLQRELIQGIKDIAEATSNLIEATVPSFSALGVPVFNVGKIIANSIRLVAQIAYTTAIVIALIQTVTDLINQFIPPVRRYRAMTIKRLFEVGLTYLGLGFQSTIFDDPRFSKAVILPNKSKRGGLFGATDDFGHPNQQSAIYNFGDFIRVMLETFNADYKIEGGVFRFERRDYWSSLSTYILPNVETNQGIRRSEFAYNTGEFLKNYFISFQTDIQDQNSLENFEGTNYQVIAEPVTTNNKKLQLGKGLAQIRPPFALGTRKDSLTEYEQLLKTLGDIADSVIGFFGGSSNLGGLIADRKGMMQLSADTITVDKFLIIEAEEMDSEQITAKELWEKFHVIESFAEVTDTTTGQTVHNQHILETAEKVPFCLDDWNKVLSNNKFSLEDGRTGEIISIEWDFQIGLASIQYKIKQLYTKNLKLVFNEGQ